MNQKIIAAMHCPHCESTFRIDQILKKEKKDIVHAIISCECRKYPILEGILILQTGENVQTVIEKLKKDSSADALEFLIQSELCDSQLTITEPMSLMNIAGSFRTWLALLRRYMVSLRRLSCIRKINEISFCEMMRKILPNYLGRNYFIHRFSYESFWNIYPLIPLIKDQGTPMLDFGCGFGHESFILSQLLPSKAIFCVEISFLKLFLVKNYFVDAEFVCLDTTSLLPFNDDFFSTIFSMDALHYVSSKQLLAEEFQRVLKTNGVLLLLHLHNAYIYNRVAGTPFPPAAYRKLFYALKTKLVPEEELLKCAVFEGQLDLTKEFSEELINSSNAVTLIGARKNNVFKRFFNVRQEFLMPKTNLRVNPIYQLKEKYEKILLVRKLPSEGYRIENPFARKTLPQEIEVDKRILHLAKNTKAATKEELKEIHSLMEKFVLINVPANYIR